MTSQKVAIIGAGPAGIAAAIQLKRYGLEPFVFESDQAGGLVRNAWKVENYPGFPDGISGIELAAIMQRQLKNAGLSPIYQKVKILAYDHDRKRFLIQTNDNEYRAGIVIVASGTRAKRPDFVNGLPEQIKKRILSEVYSILSVTDMHITIIGAGDVGLDYAVNLARNNDVTVINRSDHSYAIPLLKKLSAESDSISIMNNTEVHDVLELSDSRLEIRLKQGGVSRHCDADYIISAVGRETADDFIDDTLRQQEKELIASGIFYYAGDVANGIYRQVGIAVGDGLIAAMQIFQKVKER